MRTTIGIVAAVILLAGPGTIEGQAVSYRVKTAGDWHSPEIWAKDRVPPGDSDTNTIYVQAPLTLAKGSVSASGVYLYPRGRPVSLTIGPLAHLNVLNYCSMYRGMSYPSEMTVQGGLALQGGARLYGGVTVNIQGGYVLGIGKSWTFHGNQTKGVVVTISEGGMLVVRQLFISASCVINIEKGQARFNGIGFSGGGKIHILDGLLAVAEIFNAEHGTIVLGEHGQLLLKGRLDASNLQQSFPGVTVRDSTGPRALDSLSFSPGAGDFSDYTCVRLKKN